MINIFYRGPLERSRLGFLLELFSSLNKKVAFYWLLPHPKFHNDENKVLEPFMASFPHISYEIIPAALNQFFTSRKSVKRIIRAQGKSTVVSIGFTSAFFLPRKKLNKYIWCINGIPEESLLHKNTVLKRKAIEFKWGLVGRAYSPDLVITVSNRMNTYVSSKIPGVKTISIPLCVDLDRFRIREDVERKFFTYTGSGAPWQNLKQLSEIWGKLNQLDSSIRFRVISRDSRAKVLGNKLPEQVIEFVGTSDLDELAGYLEQAEVGFLIRTDSLVNRVSFPTKLSEYLASGAWVVSSAIDWDVGDYISKYDIGLLVDPISSSEDIALEILRKKEYFLEKNIFQNKLKSAISELGKSYWLEKGKEQLLKSKLFFNN